MKRYEMQYDWLEYVYSGQQRITWASIKVHAIHLKEV